MIELKNVNKIYNNKVNALKNINLKVEEGDIYGIIGYSGAGKSTLVRLLNGLEIATDGEVIIEGDDFNKITESERRLKRQRIGMIFQHFNLLWSRTVAENIAFPLEILGKPKNEIKERVEELAKLVGLEDRLNAYPSQLSGGQKQRVAIARALANNPKILISDESTSALDPKTTKQILSLLQELNRKLGLTIVLITHEMQIVKDIANRVAVMQDGRLIEEGSVLEIFSDPKQPLTQDFISTATGIDEAMVKIEKQEIVEHLSDNSILVQLKYAGASTDEPLLNELYKHYQVTANILYGNIEILDGTPVGELVVVLSGEKEALASAQDAIRQAGVQLKVLKGGQ